MCINKDLYLQEKKEQLEDKMVETMEVEVSMVVCSICKYRNIFQGKYCKDLGHIVKPGKAFKRFFECKQCKKRCVSLDKMPGKSCKNCGNGSWTRVGMAKARKGPKLANEALCLRGHEEGSYGNVSGQMFLGIE